MPVAPPQIQSPMPAPRPPQADVTRPSSPPAAAEPPARRPRIDPEQDRDNGKAARRQQER
jgi:hypothetical protein